MSLPRVALGSAFVLYPVLVYFGLQSSIEPRWLALLLLVLGSFRLMLGNVMDKRTTLYWAFALVFAMGVTLVTGSQYGLLAYPVLVNIAFLSVFAISLFNPPTVIERIARIREPDLPPSGVAYTRKVTLVWCTFFIVNGLISFASVFASRDWWTLYNGLISYLLMGLVFGGEYLARIRHIRLRHD